MRHAPVLALALIAVTACGGPGGGVRLPACSDGHGRDGSSSTLVVRQAGSTFTGTYDNFPAGGGAGLRYHVTGTATGGKMASTWTLGSFVLHVTGRYTASTITLDNPAGSFATTVFRAAHNCGG